MAAWMGLSNEVRIASLVLIGLMLGSLANYIIYRFAYFNPRPISPWGPLPESGPGRKFTDRIPVVGWWGLRRESELHGRGFWVRPLVIELAMAVSVPMLYRFEAITGGLLPEALRSAPVLGLFEPHGTTLFFSHMILLALMVAATFIDFDEQTIPDVITIPGTLLGLIAGALSLMVFLPTTLPVNAGAMGVSPSNLMPTTFDSPWFHRPLVIGNAEYLWIGIAIWSTWIFALSDRRFSGVLMRRRGIRRAISHFVNGMFHYGFWKVLGVIWGVGLLGILFVYRLGGDAWYGLLTSLIGLAVGGGIVWAIRIIASAAMGMEAMGFGDVTLMAMIGSFIGWQASLCAFFMAPFAAILIVAVQWIFTRNHQIPFGPYLSAGTVLTIVFWDKIFQQSLAVYLAQLGILLLWLGIVMLGLMGLMLMISRWIKSRLPAPR